MKKKIIPYGRQFIDRLDILSVKKSLSSDLITTGINTENFEKKFKKK